MINTKYEMKEQNKNSTNQKSTKWELRRDTSYEKIYGNGQDM